MSGRPWNDLAARCAIGKAVLAARRNRVPWKVLERIYNRDRAQLRRYARMQQQSPGMQHIADCAAPAAGETLTRAPA